MAALNRYTQERFEDRMVTHLREHFPEDYAALGEARARALIRLGRARAGAHGVTAEYDVCRFIDLMLVLGQQFDTELGWAAALLRSPELGASEKMDRLWARAEGSSANS